MVFPLPFATLRGGEGRAVRRLPDGIVIPIATGQVRLPVYAPDTVRVRYV